ncbi:hypothetical protein IFM89_029914 [Coptis chinensis]|uniref:Uncharacterized protein n=1 Tax=Coptis chinensis TaxID=261450 RepID=A0A835HFY7_9MAGN|nr:hypothetical protein IFM89_029914 [Coptis chinensis]
MGSTWASGDLNGGDESEGGDLEPPYVLEPDLGKSRSSVPLPSHNLTSDSHTYIHLKPEALPTITKLPIEFNEDGIAVGPNHAKWNTQVGVYVRARIPIHYKDWRKIDGSFKDNVWNKLMGVEEAIAACPDGKDPNHWAAFVEMKEQVEASNKRRKKQVAVVRRVMEVDFDNDELSKSLGRQRE